MAFTEKFMAKNTFVDYRINNENLCYLMRQLPIEMNQPGEGLPINVNYGTCTDGLQLAARCILHSTNKFKIIIPSPS